MKKAGRFFVPDEEQIQLDALAAGGWQLDHLDAALAHVKNFGVAIDGGAHVGSWTLHMATRFSFVAAFEPSPPTFDCLRENIRHMANVHAYQCALGEEAGFMGMAEDQKYSHGGNTGGRYLKGEGSIPIAPLDDFEFHDVGFLKLDVEGFELFALRGALETLMSSRPVVMIEDKARMAHRYGLEPHAAMQFLVDLGMAEVGNVGADRIFKF